MPNKMHIFGIISKLLKLISLIVNMVNNKKQKCFLKHKL